MEEIDLEVRRVAALRALDLLDTPAEGRFDRITSMASRMLDMPVSLVGLIDADRQWNKSTHGLDRSEWPLAHSICRHVVQDDAPLVVDDLTTDERFADNPFVHDGARFYAGWPLHDGEGTALGTLCVLDDTPRTLSPEQRELMSSLAEWAQAELNADVLRSALAEVQQSEARLYTLMDEAPSAVVVADAAGVVQFINARAQRLFSSGDGDRVLGRSITELLPQVVLEDLRGQGRRSSDVVQPAGRRFVQRGRRGDGSSFVAELTVSVTQAKQPRCIVFVRDLTAEEVNEAEIAALRQRTEVAFDALAEGVLVVEPDGRLSFGNQSAAQMLRRRRSDLPGARFHDLLHQSPAAREPCELVDPLVLAGRTLSPVELRRADGSVLPVEVSVRLLQGLEAAPGVVVTMHDLTHRLRADRLKNELVSAVSHELRTPLTSIRGSLSLLRAKVIDPASEQGERMIEIATDSTERLSRLVNDILDLERLQAGKVQLELARHKASSLMLAASQAVSGAAVAAGVRIDVVDTEERVIADQDRAVQILVNLLGNAVKFSPADSTVTMSARRERGRILLSVADQGRGIPPGELDRIFDRFAQVDSGDSREYEGTGLGLTIAKGLAEQHGGSLSATSVVGEGSTFTLDLPAATTRGRLLAYGPADAVPYELAQLLADRGWTARAVRAGGLAAARAGAVMLAEGDPDEVTAIADQASALQLPLLTLTVATKGGVELTAGVVEDVLPTGSGRVLVVEDDVDLGEVLAAALARRGLQVSRATTQSDAVEQVRRDRPDLVVLDIRLAGGDGFGVVDDLREQGMRDDAPVIVYSVLELDEAERARLQTGGTSFLTKGRDRIDDVVQDVLRLLGSRSGAVQPKDQV